MNKLAASTISAVLCAPMLAGAACQDVVGLVRLTPDFSCNVVAAHPPGPVFLGSPAAPISPQLGPLCYAVQISSIGLLRGASGFSGLTAEAAASIAGAGVAVSPLALFEAGPPPNAAPTRTLLSARSVLRAADGSSVFTADLILNSGASVVEQLVVIGGSGSFTGASGQVAVIGNSIGQFAPFRGQICRP
jgi:hypothetical protein